MKRIVCLLMAVVLILSLVGCGCRHEWIEATCTEPKTCTKCGEVEGESLGHSWSEATCEEPKTCSVCGETDGDPLGHSVPEDSWVIEKEAAYKIAGIRNGICKRCEKTIVDEYNLTGESYKEAFMAACKSYSYNDIARNPDEYDGKEAKFTGEVIQVQQEEFGTLIYYVMRVNVTPGRYRYSDTVYVAYWANADEDRILEDDIITMYGLLAGEKTYKTVLGASVTIPEFHADYIEIY